MNILLVRTSAMGDIVHALPVLAALRKHYPEAKIGWVVEAVFAPLLANHPDLDALIEVHTRTWRHQPMRNAWAGLRSALATLRAFGADIAIDLMGNHKGALLARLSGAKRVLGAMRRDRREPSSALWIKEQVAVAGVHAIDRVHSLLAPLGIVGPPIDLGGARLLPDAQPCRQDDAPYAVIQPGAGWGNKQYPAAWWGTVARQLADQTGWDVRVPIAPGEEELVATVAASSEGSAHSVDARAFRDLVALLRGARLVLGGDTGPIHLAHALGVPVLSVMGPTDPARHGPYGSPQSTLWQQLSCSFCYKRISGTRACLLAIPPERVARAAIASIR